MRKFPDGKKTKRNIFWWPRHYTMFPAPISLEKSGRNLWTLSRKNESPYLLRRPSSRKTLSRLQGILGCCRRCSILEETWRNSWYKKPGKPSLRQGTRRRSRFQKTWLTVRKDPQCQGIHWYTLVKRKRGKCYEERGVGKMSCPDG